MSAQPLWSILICTVPNRRVEFESLWKDLERQTTLAKVGERIELLSLRDNKMRSVGHKRQALLDIAGGKYVSFVDDDDAVTSDYVPCVLSVLRNDNPDVVTFKVRVTIDGEREGTVSMLMSAAPEPNSGALRLPEYEPPYQIARPPHMLAVWRTDVARKGRFPDESFRDDFEWAAQVWPHALREIHLDKTLYWWKGRAQDKAEMTGS